MYQFTLPSPEGSTRQEILNVITRDNLSEVRCHPTPAHPREGRSDRVYRVGKPWISPIESLCQTLSWHQQNLDMCTLGYSPGHSEQTCAR
ncbi:rCG42568, partial [Rattus norvegicus]